MPEQCSTCRSVISRNNPGLQCLGGCCQWYHTKCHNVPAELADCIKVPGFSWSCKLCINNSKSGVISRDIQDLITNFEILKNKQEDMLKSIEFSSECVDQFNTKINEFASALKKIEYLEKKVVDLEAENSVLKTEMEELHQYSRKNNVEINGVPEKNGENVLNIVKSIGNLVGVQFETSCIDACHRVRSHNPDRKNKTIIVRFTSRLMKQNFQAAAKLNKHQLTSSKIGITSTSDQQIYVSDHLIPANKALLYKTKNVCREKNFKFVWVNDCKILVRKSETSRIIHIQNVTSLSKIV